MSGVASDWQSTFNLMALWGPPGPSSSSMMEAAITGHAWMWPLLLS